jgi:hypothetical protein
MGFLGEANEEEKRFYEDYRPQGMLMPRGRLTENLWRNNLLHPEAKNHISSIFQMLVPAARAAKGMELKASGKLQGLDPRFKQDPATSTVTFAKTFFWAVQVLGTIVPELYVRTDVAAGITAVPSDPPASIAGQALLSGFQPSELAFICAKHLSGYRGESYIRASSDAFRADDHVLCRRVPRRAQYTLTTRHRAIGPAVRPGAREVHGCRFRASI